MPTPQFHYIDFRKELSEIDKKLVYALIMKKMPPPDSSANSSPADSQVRLRREGTVKDDNVVIVDEIEYCVSLSNPLLLFFDDIVDKYRYAIKARKREEKAEIGDGAFGKAMVLLGFIDLDHAKHTTGVTANDEDLLVKVNRLNRPGSLSDIRSEAAFNNLLYQRIKRPIYSVGHHTYKIAKQFIKQETVKSYQIMQRLPGVTLDVILEKWQKHSPTYEERLKVGAAVVKAVLELRKRGIIHRDLKRENILFDIKTNKAYVIDPGLATHDLASKSERSGMKGTPAYADPTLMLSHYDAENKIKWPIDNKVNNKTDVRSLAGVLWEIFADDYEKVVADIDKILEWKKSEKDKWFEDAARVVAKAKDPLATLNKFYPQFNFTVIDKLPIPDEHKTPIKELLIQMSDFDPRNRPFMEDVDEIFSFLEDNLKGSIAPAGLPVTQIQIDEAIEASAIIAKEILSPVVAPVLKHSNAKVEVPTNLGAKVGLVVAILFLAAITLTGGVLLLTGLFTWLGVGMMGAGMLGIASLSATAGYFHFKNNKVVKPVLDIPPNAIPAQSESEINQVSDVQIVAALSHDIKNDNAEVVVESDPYYAPLCKNEKASWEKVKNYFPLEFMLGYKRADNFFAPLRKENSKLPASSAPPQLVK